MSDRIRPYGGQTEACPDGWFDVQHARSVHVIERCPMPPLGHVSLIRFGQGSAAVPTARAAD